jgi:hypothetical protein
MRAGPASLQTAREHTRYKRQRCCLQDVSAHCGELVVKLRAVLHSSGTTLGVVHNQQRRLPPRNNKQHSMQHQPTHLAFMRLAFSLVSCCMRTPISFICAGVGVPAAAAAPPVSDWAGVRGPTPACAILADAGLTSLLLDWSAPSLLPSAEASAAFCCARLSRSAPAVASCSGMSNKELISRAKQFSTTQGTKQHLVLSAFCRRQPSHIPDTFRLSLAAECCAPNCLYSRTYSSRSHPYAPTCFASSSLAAAVASALLVSVSLSAVAVSSCVDRASSCAANASRSAARLATAGSPQAARACKHQHQHQQQQNISFFFLLLLSLCAL